MGSFVFFSPMMAFFIDKRSIFDFRLRGDLSSLYQYHTCNEVELF